MTVNEEKMPAASGQPIAAHFSLPAFHAGIPQKALQRFLRFF